MRKEVEDRLIAMLVPYMSAEDLEEVKMRITMILSDYHIDQEERALAVYEADETQVVLKKFLAAKIAAGLSPNTIVNYKSYISKVLRTIGKPYDEITADDIRYYLAMRVQRDGITKTSANNERRPLSSFYAWLQKEEILLKNPMSKVDGIKDTKKKKRAFSKLELEEIREACRSTREQLLVEILISTWARVSEIAQIRIDEIEEDKVLVHGKGDKDRLVYLTAKAQLLLKKYLEERTDHNPYLFPRAKYTGDAIKYTAGIERSRQACWYMNSELVAEEGHANRDTLEALIRNIGKRAGVANCHPHRFRRTGATMALRAGMPLMQVSKLLGHAQIGTTQIYLDISDEELMQAHEKYVM